MQYVHMIRKIHFPHSCDTFSCKKNFPPSCKLRRESAADAEQSRQTDGLINGEILGFWVGNQFSPTWKSLHNSKNQFLEASILDIPAICPSFVYGTFQSLLQLTLSLKVIEKITALCRKIVRLQNYFFWTVMKSNKTAWPKSKNCLISMNSLRRSNYPYVRKPRKCWHLALLRQ